MLYRDIAHIISNHSHSPY